MADMSNIKIAKTYETRALQNRGGPKITVDIIIPFHALADKMIAAVKSIFKHTRSTNYEICLVDDCSPNARLGDSFTKAPHTKYIRLDKQVGFGGAVDMGLKETNNPWVCILHSDCEIMHPQWLTELLRCVNEHRKDKVIMVSARTDNPGDHVSPLLKANRGDVRDDVILEEGFLPMYCVLLHRQLFRALGSYIRAYPYAYYEDEELAARMRQKGLKQAICGTSWVHHIGGATINYLCKKQSDPKYSGPDYKKIMEANYDRCLADISKLTQPTEQS